MKIHSFIVENHPHPDWPFNLLPGGIGGGHASGWYPQNVITNFQVTAAGGEGDDTINPGVELMAELKNPGQVADLVSWTLLTDPLQRQALLETLNVEFRLRRLIHFLMAEAGRSSDN